MSQHHNAAVKSQGKARRRFLVLRPSWWAHAIVFVVLITIMLAAWITGPKNGTNIGAGLLALVVLALGLPWSLLFFAIPIEDWPVAARVSAIIAAAAVNLLLHAIALAVRARRSPPGAGEDGR